MDLASCESQGSVWPDSMGNEVNRCKTMLEPPAIVAGGMTYKVHLDGYDWTPYFKWETQQGPRKEFLYWTDDGDLAALRYNKWKLLFLVQRAHGFDVWQEPFVSLRVPILQVIWLC